MSKLLTEQELTDKIYDITQTMFVTLSEWQAGVTINWESAKIKGRAELKDLIQSQKQAHADMVVGEDYKPSGFDERYVKHIPPSSTRYEAVENALVINEELAEQRERNVL